MGKMPRGRITEGTFFVTAQTWERQRLFQSARMAEPFLATLFSYRTTGKYLLHEFVLMPNHFHLLITPTEALERALQFIKGGFSYRAKKELDYLHEIWQRGFSDHRIRDVTDYLHHRDYIQENPVKAGLASKPEEYPYSSASGKYELDEIPQRLKPMTVAMQRHG
jgi:putative transposase